MTSRPFSLATRDDNTRPCPGHSGARRPGERRFFRLLPRILGRLPNFRLEAAPAWPQNPPGRGTPDDRSHSERQGRGFLRLGGLDGRRRWRAAEAAERPDVPWTAGRNRKTRAAASAKGLLGAVLARRPDSAARLTHPLSNLAPHLHTPSAVWAGRIVLGEIIAGARAAPACWREFAIVTRQS